jgi:integrase
MKSHAGPAWIGDDYDLVATTAFGTAINQRNVHRSLATACKQLGIEPAISGYDLRHTAITFQVERGHTVHQIADWAGTSERMILDVYRHKLDDVSDLGPSDEGRLGDTLG